MLIINTPVDQPSFERLLGDGSRWGMAIRYAVQPSPDGLAQAFLIDAEFLASAPAALVLGDNLFHGHDLVPQLAASNGSTRGATMYAYPVRNPERYGVVAFDGPRHGLAGYRHLRFAARGQQHHPHAGAAPGPEGGLPGGGGLAPGLDQRRAAGAAMATTCCGCCRRAPAPLPSWPRHWRPGRCSGKHDGSRPGNSQIAADLAHQQGVDLVVPGNGAAPVELGLVPPGVVAAFAQQGAAVLA